MTYKKALNIDQKWTAEQARNDIERYLLRDEKPAYKAVALAMQALERQIPKKYLLVDGECICPTCKANKRSLDYYCDRCGQAIDWSDI